MHTIFREIIRLIWRRLDQQTTPSLHIFILQHILYISEHIISLLLCIRIAAVN